MFFQYLIQKNFAWEISSESLQIHYMDTLYHTLLYVCDYKLINSIIFLHFEVFFSVFTLKKLTGNIITSIFHHNFNFFVFIISIFHLMICVKLYAR